MNLTEERSIASVLDTISVAHQIVYLFKAERILYQWTNITEETLAFIEENSISGIRSVVSTLIPTISSSPAKQ
ncbi:hypothetical protein ACTQ5J_02905 [Fundicoccus sp. Sow4_F4]|uniref:hypothetical protein n=1 Tax=Fundicoccus sp. Sow4_F4 TaxID=3438783 RepID=UPI003F91DA5C